MNIVCFSSISMRVNCSHHLNASVYEVDQRRKKIIIMARQLGLLVLPRNESSENGNMKICGQVI